MTAISGITLEVPDATSAHAFYTTAFGAGAHVSVRSSDAPTTGFRGFMMSLLASQPSNVDNLINGALDAGARTLKPVQKSMWGYGGVVQAPDGTIWKVATSAKKDTGPSTRQIDQVVLVLGAEDVIASKRFYVDHGLTVEKSFVRTYVQFDKSSGPVQLALYRRGALAKDAGVSSDGAGSHRLIIGSNTGPFSDPDGFRWEPTPLAATDDSAHSKQQQHQ